MYHEYVPKSRVHKYVQNKTDVVWNKSAKLKVYKDELTQYIGYF